MYNSNNENMNNTIISTETAQKIVDNEPPDWKLVHVVEYRKTEYKSDSDNNNRWHHIAIYKHLLFQDDVYYQLTCEIQDGEIVKNHISPQIVEADIILEKGSPNSCVGAWIKRYSNYSSDIWYINIIDPVAEVCWNLEIEKLDKSSSSSYRYRITLSMDDTSDDSEYDYTRIEKGKINMPSSKNAKRYALKWCTEILKFPVEYFEKLRIASEIQYA